MERTVDLKLEVDAPAERSVELEVEFPGIPTGGTTDHSKLSNRDKEGQHPISAITGLVQELLSKLSRNELESAILAALALARDSGEFDGDPGYTPQKGIDYFDGQDGYTPQKNVDYFDDFYIWSK